MVDFLQCFSRYYFRRLSGSGDGIYRASECRRFCFGFFAIEETKHSFELKNV